MNSAIASATILPFRQKIPLRPQGSPARFSLRERAQVVEWQHWASRVGLTRMVVEHEAEQGGFLLVYDTEKPWAAYGIGIEHGRFIVWRPATGVTFGAFDLLSDALAAVIANRLGAGSASQARVARC